MAGVIDTIAVGRKPLGVAAQGAGFEDRDILYVANNADNTVSRIDVGTTQIHTIEVGAGPTRMALISGLALYVINNFDDTISEIDAHTFTVSRTFPGPSGMNDVAWALNEVVGVQAHYLYVVDGSSQSLSAFDLDAVVPNVVSRLKVGDNPTSVAFEYYGSRVCVAHMGESNVGFARADGLLPVVLRFPVEKPSFATAISFNGSRVYVSHPGTLGSPTVGTVSVIDEWQGLVETISVGRNPFGVALSPDDRLVYVANYGDDTVSVIDTSTAAVIDTISVGKGPVHVAVSGTGRVFVSNVNDNTVSVLA